MRIDVSNDMAWSAKLFQDQVWPIIKPILGGGDLMQMEGRPDTELSNKLDMIAGIDGWHINNLGMRGIASRIQKSNKCWGTFTIRMKRDNGAKTEFEKRKIAIKECNQGWIYPAITVQAYAKTKTGPIISCGVAYTSDIIEFIEKGLATHNRTTNACFAVCCWSKMKANGYRVSVIKQ